MTKQTIRGKKQILELDVSDKDRFFCVGKQTGNGQNIEHSALGKQAENVKSRLFSPPPAGSIVSPQHQSHTHS